MTNGMKPESMRWYLFLFSRHRTVALKKTNKCLNFVFGFKMDLQLPKTRKTQRDGPRRRRKEMLRLLLQAP